MDAQILSDDVIRSQSGNHQISVQEPRLERLIADIRLQRYGIPEVGKDVPVILAEGAFLWPFKGAESWGRLGVHSDFSSTIRSKAGRFP